MESNDNECAYGYIRYDRIPNVIESFAAIKDSKEETNIGRIEKDDMQHVLLREESIQVPGENKNTGRKAQETADEIAYPTTISEQMVLTKEVADIIIR